MCRWWWCGDVVVWWCGDVVVIVWVLIPSMVLGVRVFMVVWVSVALWPWSWNVVWVALCAWWVLCVAATNLQYLLFNMCRRPV
jgi:hypothetical protein